VTELEAFLACFPGGSITGAPKIRSMEIINELEISSRNAYCGSVFYLNQNGNFDSNILIRTVVKDGEHLYCWAGGGIVADSEVLDEYQESLTKVANITGITE
jgi:para-aminobenzoate synthetase component 1